MDHLLLGPCCLWLRQAGRQLLAEAPWWSTGRCRKPYEASNYSDYCFHPTTSILSVSLPAKTWNCKKNITDERCLEDLVFCSIWAAWQMFIREPLIWLCLGEGGVFFKTSATSWQLHAWLLIRARHYDKTYPAPLSFWGPEDRFIKIIVKKKSTTFSLCWQLTETVK